MNWSAILTFLVTHHPWRFSCLCTTSWLCACSPSKSQCRVTIQCTCMLCSSNLCYHKQAFGPPCCCWLSHEIGIGLKAVLLQQNLKKSVVDEGQLVVLWTGNRETLIVAVIRKNIAPMKRARFRVAMLINANPNPKNHCHIVNFAERFWLQIIQ